MRKRDALFGFPWIPLLAAAVFMWGCPGDNVSKQTLEVPRGYVQVLEIDVGGVELVDGLADDGFSGRQVGVPFSKGEMGAPMPITGRLKSK